MDRLRIELLKPLAAATPVGTTAAACCRLNSRLSAEPLVPALLRY